MTDTDTIQREAIAALQSGDLSRAKNLATRLVELKPETVSGYQILAVCAYEDGELDKALDIMNEALKRNPDAAESYNQKSIIYNKQKKFGKAIECLERAIELQPKCHFYYMNMSGNLKSIGKIEEAMEWLERSLEFAEDPYILTRLAGGCLNLQQFDKAKEYFNRSFAIAPDLMLTHHEIGYLHFYKGEWMEAWPKFEMRLNLFKDLNFYIKQFGLDLHWKKGEDLGSASLMVHTEQGNGDTIQFMRYLPLIKERYPDCKLNFLVYDSLEGVAKNMNLRVDNLIVFYPGSQAMVPHFDRYTSLMSLPHLLDQAYPVKPLPLMKRDPRQFPDPDAFNVVICHAGNSDHENDNWRSCHLRHFAKLAEIPGVKLHTLSRPHGTRIWGETPVDLQEGANFPYTDLSHLIHNFQDSSEYIQNADLVITVDTSVLHLAGSVGTETWGVLPYYAEWRWGSYPNKTVWYPSVTLFRQKTPGDWESLFDRMETELRKKVSA